MPSSRNCCRESTSLLPRLWLGLLAPVARRTCKGLWWDEREEVGCCTGLLPLLDHTSCSRLRLNSPLLSLCGLLRLPFSVPAGTEGGTRRGGGDSHMVGPSSIFISQSCIRTKVTAAFVLFTNEYAVDGNM